MFLRKLSGFWTGRSAGDITCGMMRDTASIIRGDASVKVNCTLAHNSITRTIPGSLSLKVNIMAYPLDVTASFTSCYAWIKNCRPQC
jgi:hypothetical protein